MDNGNAPSLVLGTAGHIDHGKSSLVLALTGVNPDRLAEEKKRGITIELGFAQLTLPDGRTMGVVDVPGHERFVRQMIAGATGIDVALLVIAADDGIMPQTTEHIAVLQTLGIDSCVVALTKIDMVDEEWLELVEDDVRGFLSNTPYANAPIVRCSSRTGEGLDDVRAAISEACNSAPALHRSNALRQPVDRVFTIKGAGTVITGTLWSGVAHPEDTVEILPSGKRCRIRTVQMHDHRVDQAPAGNRVALNLSDVKTDEIHPGDFLASPGAIHPTEFFDCYFTYLDTANTGKPLTSGARMHIAHGTKEVLGRLLLADGQPQLASGQSCYAQIRLEEPLPVSCQDRFIARTYSPVHVAGGGQVLLVHPRRRTTLGDQKNVLDALREGDFQKAVRIQLELLDHPCTAAEMARLFGTDTESMQLYLNDVLSAGDAIALGEASNYFTTKLTLERMLSIMERNLESFHKANPTDPGMKKETLRQQCFPRMDDDRFDCLLNVAFDRGTLSVSKGLVGHSSAQDAAHAAENEAGEKLLACLKANGMVPPELKDLAAEAKVALPLARRAIAALLENGRVYRVAPELYYHIEVINDCKQRVAEVAGREEGASVGDLREAMGVSRKYAVPVLEAFDAEGFTVRNGDKRFLK